MFRRIIKIAIKVTEVSIALLALILSIAYIYHRIERDSQLKKLKDIDILIDSILKNDEIIKCNDLYYTDYSFFPFPGFGGRGFKKTCKLKIPVSLNIEILIYHSSNDAKRYLNKRIGIFQGYSTNLKEHYLECSKKMYNIGDVCYYYKRTMYINEIVDCDIIFSKNNYDVNVNARLSDGFIRKYNRNIDETCLRFAKLIAGVI